MHEEFFGLREPPFGHTPDPRFYYRTGSHERAYEQIRFGVRRGEGFIVVYGDLGTGKTALCRALFEGVGDDQSHLYVSLLLNPFLSEVDLLRAILEDFGVLSAGIPGLEKRVTKNDMVTHLNTFLLTIAGLDARAVLVVDEAQNIPIPTLEQIRILSNLETSKKKLLQIILVGRPELKDVLARPELRQLNQRISIRCELEPFTPEETADYIHYRIALASEGITRVTFGPGALEVIQQHSGGRPRAINLIADRCLTLAGNTRVNSISEKTAQTAVKNMELRAKRQSHPVPVAAIVTGVLLLGFFLSWLLLQR